MRDSSAVRLDHIGFGIALVSCSNAFVLCDRASSRAGSDGHSGNRWPDQAGQTDECAASTEIANPADARVGTPGRDRFEGSDAPEAFDGIDGADNIGGGDGCDAISGGRGDDYLFGDAGSDLLTGGPGRDLLIGGGDNDILVGGDSFDHVWGYVGDDFLWGGGSTDYLVGGSGNDTVVGGEGDDSLSGGPGDDTIIGGAGDDLILPGPGVNAAYGGNGDDHFYIFHPCEVRGASRIDGGAGVDTLWSAVTADELRAMGVQLNSVEHVRAIAAVPQNHCMFDEADYVEVAVRVEARASRNAHQILGTAVVDDVLHGPPNLMPGDRLAVLRPSRESAGNTNLRFDREARLRLYLRIIHWPGAGPAFVDLDTGGPMAHVEMLPSFPLPSRGSVPTAPGPNAAFTIRSDK